MPGAARPIPFHAAGNLPPTMAQESLSDAFVRAISAQGHYTVLEGPKSDAEGYDIQISRRKDAKRVTIGRLAVQLKATARPAIKAGSVGLRGVQRDYWDDLADTDRPEALIVVLLVHDSGPQHWLSHADGELTIRGTAYWTRIRARPFSGRPRSKTTTLWFDESARFTLSALDAIMDLVEGRDYLPYE